MNAQNLKMESGAGEWMQTQYEISFSNFRESNARNFFSFVFLFLRTITMQKLFLWLFDLWWKQMQTNMNDARIEWPDSGASALIPNVAGWKLGRPNGCWRFKLDQPKMWPVGRYGLKSIVRPETNEIWMSCECYEE